MEQKTGSFYKIKNNEQEEKNRKYLIDWGHIVNPIWGEKEQEISIEPRAGLTFGDWLMI